MQLSVTPQVVYDRANEILWFSKPKVTLVSPCFFVATCSNWNSCTCSKVWPTSDTYPTVSQEDKLPPFSIQHPYVSVELPTPFPETQLSRHGVTSLLPDLLSTLTATWLWGPHWRASKESLLTSETQRNKVKDWSNHLESYFNNSYLTGLEEASGDYGRIVFLHFFEFTLFHLVKKTIVNEGSGEVKGIQVAVDKITYASPFPCLHGQS